MLRYLLAACLLLLIATPVVVRGAEPEVPPVEMNRRQRAIYVRYCRPAVCQTLHPAICPILNPDPDPDPVPEPEPDPEELLVERPAVVDGLGVEVGYPLWVDAAGHLRSVLVRDRLDTTWGYLTVPAYAGTFESALEAAVVGSVHFELPGCVGRAYSVWATSGEWSPEQGNLVVAATPSLNSYPLLRRGLGWWRVKVRAAGSVAVKSHALTDGRCLEQPQILNPSSGGVAELQIFEFPVAMPGLKVEAR